MCEDLPCKNGACNNLRTNYTCTCKPGFKGRNCSESKVLYSHNTVFFLKNQTLIVALYKKDFLYKLSYQNKKKKGVLVFVVF